jgi:UDP-galactopyranose mutase
MGRYSADERKANNESEGPRSEYIKKYRDWKSYRNTRIHSTDQMRLHVPYKMEYLAMLQSHLSTNLSGIP